MVVFNWWSFQDSEQDSERSHQMAMLRSLCLPRLSFLLLSVLQNSSRHQEALRLADIISSDQHRLYLVTTPHLFFLEFCIKVIDWFFCFVLSLSLSPSNLGFLKRRAQAFSSEIAWIVTLSVGQRTWPPGLWATAMNEHTHTYIKSLFLTSPIVFVCKIKASVF